jgi:thioredoxin 1
MAERKGIINITEENFDKVISGESVLVDFWAPWCAPCRMQTPILEDLEKEVGGRAVIGKLNVDDAPSVASRFGIISIPTLMIFSRGEPVRQFVGVQMKETLAEALEKTGAPV